jgi:hypothetical protein
MASWRVEEGPQGLRLAKVVRRSFGSEEMTWADLLQLRLSSVRVFVLYFPSHWDLEADARAEEALRAFGRLTGVETQVNFWDATDVEFHQGLSLFDLQASPALVVATGLREGDAAPRKSSSLYSIAITDQAVLSDREQLARAVNTAHEVMVRGNSDEIAGFLRARAATSVLSAVGAIAADLRDGLVKLKPKLGLPGGVSIQLG